MEFRGAHSLSKEPLAPRGVPCWWASCHCASCHSGDDKNFWCTCSPQYCSSGHYWAIGIDKRRLLRPWLSGRQGVLAMGRTLSWRTRRPSGDGMGNVATGQVCSYGGLLWRPYVVKEVILAAKTTTLRSTAFTSSLVVSFLMVKELKWV